MPYAHSATSKGVQIMWQLYPWIKCGACTADPQVRGVGIYLGQSPCRQSTPCRRGEAPISTTLHDERQLLVNKRLTRRDDGPARPDSDTTMLDLAGGTWHAGQAA